MKSSSSPLLPRPRIVLDTNILVSALVFGGTPRQVTDLIPDGKVTLFISPEILTELRRIIISKFPAFTDQLQQLEKLLERDARLVKLGSIKVDACRDPDDNRIIETAILGICDFIVSGDKDLLSLGAYGGIRILSAADYIALHSS